MRVFLRYEQSTWVRPDSVAETPVRLIILSEAVKGAGRQGELQQQGKSQWSD